MFKTKIRKEGKSAEKQLLPLQSGDVPNIYADVADLAEQYNGGFRSEVQHSGIQCNEFKLI
mgnify:CR=1 FL=1